MTNFFSKNITYLREQRELKQTEAATALNIKRSTYANYESGSTEPGFDLVQKFVLFFGVDAQKLLFEDLAKGNLITTQGDLEKGNLISKPIGNPKGKKPLVYTLDKPPLNAVTTTDAGANYGVRTPAVITVDVSGNEAIVDVPEKAAAGYISGYKDPKFISKLNKWSMPGFTNGTYRRFQVSGQSMSPTIRHHDWLLCRWIENIDSIVDDHVHIVVTHEGIVAKRLLNRLGVRNKIVCKSDNISRIDYPTYELDPEQIREIWYPLLRLTPDFTGPTELYGRVNNLEAEVVELQALNKGFADDIQAIHKLLKIKKPSGSK